MFSKRRVKVSQCFSKYDIRALYAFFVNNQSISLSGIDTLLGETTVDFLCRFLKSGLL